MYKAYTHSGLFHADDVFAWAAIKIAFGYYKLVRVDKVPDDIDDTDIVFDIGGGKFDHHKDILDYRPNGIPYAAFGLIMREFYPKMGLDEDSYKYLDNIFIKKMDAYDNAYNDDPNVLSNAITTFYPAWDEEDTEEAQMKAFNKATDVAVALLRSHIDNATAKIRAKRLADDLSHEVYHTVVFLDQFMPISGMFRSNPEVHWIGFPSNRGGYNISSVPGPYARNKSLLPKVHSSELPEGMKFMHIGRFLANFDSKESAMKYAEQYL